MEDGAPKTAFNISSTNYTGPLDLLIDLIEKRKFLVNDISITSVTDDYMAYVAQFEHSPLRDMAEFIVLASTLLLLKSKSLLPILELTESEEEHIDDLEKRLKLYQIYRNAGARIGELFGKKRLYGRKFVPHKEQLFITDAYTNTTSLHHALTDVLAHLPKKVDTPKVRVRSVVSLETMMERLKERIERQMNFTFKEFTGSNVERSVIVVGFLAILEMVKQGGLLVKQSERFTDIELERDRLSVPKYQ